jgi:hypothetical protein
MAILGNCGEAATVIGTLCLYQRTELKQWQTPWAKPPQRSQDWKKFSTCSQREIRVGSLRA